MRLSETDPGGGDGRVAAVVLTYNRRDEVLHTLRQLTSLPERPYVVVVDNASTDGTADAVAAAFPGAQVLRLPRARGAFARNLGTARVEAPYVAFADDDSWWSPGALGTAADLFDVHPRLGLLAARILVAPELGVDPVSEEMARSPLAPASDLPGVPVLGFLSCAAIVRREAFRSVGGFHRLAGIGGEETLLAMDLVAAGWGVSYVEDVVAVHRPSPTRNPNARRANELGNILLRAVLRLPVRRAMAAVLPAVAAAGNTEDTRRVLAGTFRALPGLLRERKVVTSRLLGELTTLDGAGAAAIAARRSG